MREDEVLPARLADEARIVGVAGEIRRDRLPQRLENFRRPGEMDSAQMAVGQQPLADDRRGTGHEVDDAGR